MINVRLLIGSAVGVMLVATGCAGATESIPAAAPSTTSVMATAPANGAWDPCTIPDAAIEDAGLAVETKSSNLVGELPISENWMTCIWTNPLPTRGITSGSSRPMRAWTIYVAVDVSGSSSRLRASTV